MGGQSTVTIADKQTTVQVQQSAYGIPIPVVYGTNRIAGNLVWFANFTPAAQTTTSGGKGMGGSSTNTTYTYTASCIMALCEGTIAGIGNVWKDKEQSSLSALGLTLFTGSPTQSVWSFMTGYSNSTTWAEDQAIGMTNYSSPPSFVSQAINYSGTAYLGAAAYDLGNGAQIPNHNFEIQGLNIVGGGNSDANPAAIIPDILTNQQYGVGFNSGWMASLTSGAASYSTYCQAVGLFVSPAYIGQRSGTDVIQELCDATNAGAVWSGGQLKIIPYGDTAITGSGTTYTPVLTPLYDLADDDFIDNGGAPVLVTRKTPADAYNRISVQFKNRANSYNQEIAYAEDQDAIEKYGLKIASQITMDFVCVPNIAKQMAQLALQRMLYKRNTYEFELNARYPMLEPMDIVTITDSGLGMSKLPVRITAIEEQEDSFKITAEDLNAGVAQASTYAHDSGARWTSATDLVPANCAAPVIFEMPADPSATGLSVGIAVGGQTTDLAYGGCNVWLSLDGTNYKQEGTIWGSSRYGTLSASLAAHASGSDTTNTAHLSLRSNGQMLSGAASDVAKGTTLIVCGGEYFAYQTATLTGTNAYDLTTLNRGLYGTTGSSHVSAATWVRVDDAIAQLRDLDLTMVGQTVYIKVTAFNIYGRAEQSLASVSAYTYTITGNMKALETPVDFATEVGGSAKPENNADVTSSIVGLATVTVQADYTGAVTSSLPVTQNFTLIRNGVDVTTSATWSVAVTSGTISASIGAATGILSVNTSSGVLTNSVMTITAVYGATTRTFKVDVVKELGLPPSGGSSGGTSASSGYSGTTTSTTMVALSPELVIIIGSGGTATLSASYTFTASTGTKNINAQWYKWNGSAYVALGSAVLSTDPTVTVDGTPGDGTCGYSDTSLTAGSTQKYKLYMANDTGTVTRTISGSVAAVGS